MADHVIRSAEAPMLYDEVNALANRAEAAEATLERLAAGLRERGVIPGRNPDGVNDDPEKALTLLDDAMKRIAELETALGRLLAALTDEESEHGFPFNFEARDALAEAMRIHEKGGDLDDR